MADNNELIIRINGTAKDFLEELDKVEKKTQDLSKVLDKTAKTSAIAFAGFAAAIATATSAFIDYETALIGVGKTTNIEGKKLEDFGKQFQKLSDEVPLATNELLGIAQAAGQLGVTGEKNLLKFTETVAKLGVATDLSGEQAATTLTRILNATGEGIETIDTFGSVIVALGNNFAATESEIARMANEVARATGVFGVSAAEAAALGTAMKSVGIQAELGGSAVGKTFREIDSIVRTGGKKLEELAQVAGVTGAEFKKVFQEDSVAGFQLFIEGLGRVVAEGGSAAQTLERFGLKGDEINKVLPILAKNSELVGSALETANKETKNATALNAEAEKAFATLGAEKQKLINTAIDLATEIGKELAPTIKEIIVDTRDFLKALRETDSNLIKNIASFLKWGAVITGAVTGISAFLLGAIKVSAIITAIGAAFLPATVAASGFWVALTGPVGIAVAGIAAVTAGIIALSRAASKEEKPETIAAINRELSELKERRDELQKNNNFSFRNQIALDNIKKEIKELEKLREAKVRATEDFGTGSLLVRPEADKQAGLNLGASAFGIQEQTVPLRPESEDESVKNAKKTQAQITATIDEETQKRIDKLRQAVAEEQAILAARGQYETDEEKKLAERKQEILNQKTEASKIANDTERELAIESLNLKHQEELASIEQQLTKIAEKKAESAAQQKIIDDALREEQVANRELLTEEDLIALEERLLTEDEMKRVFAQQEAQRIIDERNKRLEDEQLYGQQLAAISAFFRQQEIQGAKDGSAQLIKLTQSKNETLKGIGKAAAQTNAAISTAEGAIAAYKSLAGIPFVGPALGIAAAAALTAYGLEQQQQIMAANTGGVVPLRGGGSVGRDSQLSFLTPGEVIAPDSSFDEVVEGTALARGFTPPEDSEVFGAPTRNELTIYLEPMGDFIDIIERKRIETEVQNTGVR